MNVCPLHKAGTAKSQKPSRVAVAPTLGSGDKVLPVARRPSMFNGPARKLQRKQREWMRGKREETFAFLLLKANLQVKSSQGSSHVSGKENKKQM